MKRLISALLIALAFTPAFAIYEYTQNVGRLPAPAIAFIKKHFSNTSISGIKIDKNLVKIVKFEVMLNDGAELTFTPEGDWTIISNRVAGLPLGVLERNILAYIEQNYFGKKTISLSRTSEGVSVKLENGLVLFFDDSGKFTGSNSTPSLSK